MSFVDIVVDSDGYGAAGMLITSIDRMILKQWVIDLDSCCFVRFLVRRFSVINGQLWWVICFELLNLSKLSLNTAADVYNRFFRSTILDGWHPDVIMESDKMMGRCGSGMHKGCAITDEECQLIAEFLKAERQAVERKHKCYLEFKEYLRQNHNSTTTRNMQELAQKYNLCGGKWLIFTLNDETDNLTETGRQPLNCVYRSIEMARNLWALIFDGVIDANGIIIDYIDLHNYHSSSVVGIGNNSSTANFQNNGYCCLFDDKDVKAVLEEIRPLVYAYDRNVIMKYKPEVYSACNIVNGNDWSLKPTIYTAVLDSNRFVPACNCGALHRIPF